MTINTVANAAPTPPPKPSFLRRHPILAFFGVLSGISLFAALWPVSAIVVGVAAGARATGLDHAVAVEGRRLVTRVAERWHEHQHPTPVPAPRPAPPVAAVRRPSPQARVRRPGPRAPAVRSAPRRATAPDEAIVAGIDSPGM